MGIVLPSVNYELRDVTVLFAVRSCRDRHTHTPPQSTSPAFARVALPRWRRCTRMRTLSMRAPLRALPFLRPHCSRRGTSNSSRRINNLALRPITPPPPPLLLLPPHPGHHRHRQQLRRRTAHRLSRPARPLSPHLTMMPRRRLLPSSSLRATSGLSLR